MKTCIWCRKTDETTTFNKEAHTIPQSLGGQQICENVCDQCNAYFGSPQMGRPSIEVCLKEALGYSRFHFINKSRGPQTIIWGKEVKRNFQPGYYKSTFFKVNFEPGKRTTFRVKPAYSLKQHFQETITRQFKRGLYKVFLEETERQRGNALEDRFDFIREFARYDLNDLPVLHFEKNNGLFMYIDDFIIHPQLFMKETHGGHYYREEYGFFEFELFQHVFAIATSKLWHLTFDIYTQKTLADKAQDYSGYRLVKDFEDTDFLLIRAHSKSWNNGLILPEGKRFFAAIIRVNDTYVLKCEDIVYRANFEKTFQHNNYHLMAYAEDESPELAQLKSQNMLLDLCKTEDEKVGLQYHFLGVQGVEKKIEEFEGLKLHDCSDNEIVNLLESIIGPTISTMTLKYKGGRYIYRGRKQDMNKPSFEVESELWSPPSQHIDSKIGLKKLPIGRLNTEEESLLYTSTSSATIPAELDLTPEESYYLIKYRIKEGSFLRLAVIGLLEQDHINLSFRTPDQSTWTSQAKRNYEILTQFLRKVFTKKVSKEEQYLHKVTTTIVHRYFNSPDIDGYIYPAIDCKIGYNIAIKEDVTKQVLEFVKVGIFTYMYDFNDGIMVLPGMYQSDSIVNGKIHYVLAPEPEENKPIDF